MYETRYFRASSIVDAHDLFSKGEEPAFLAGGHTLIPTMKSRLVRADRLIDIRAIPETQGLRTADGTLFLGSSTTHATVAASPEVVSTFPVLAGLAGSIGDVQVRHMGTIGGSVANCDPAADYPAAVLGAGARIVTDRRTMDADDFFCGLYATALEEGEIILRFEFPIPAEAAYAKFRNPASRYALAAVFVTRSAGGDIRVAVTGAGNDGVFRWARGRGRTGARFRCSKP